MKKIALLVVTIVMASGFALAGDITLDAPEVVLAPAVKVKLLSYTVSDTAVVIRAGWVDEAGNIVKAESIVIEDADGGTNFTDLSAIQVAAGDVGNSLLAVVEKKIRQAGKVVYGIVGTVN